MVRLICYNIEYCEGMLGAWWEYLKFWRVLRTPPTLKNRIIAALRKRKPDIFAMVEADIGSFRSRHKDQVRYFADQLGFKSIEEAIKYPLQGWLRLFHYVPILNKQANAIISRYRISSTKYHVLHEGTKRVVIEVTVHVPEKLTLLLAHLALGASARRRQIHELVGIVNAIPNPVILMGDFNTFHGESEILYLLKHTHLFHRWKLSPNAKYTEPAVAPSRRLDYVLTSDHVHVKHYHALDFKFSDHLPLEVDFDVMPGRHTQPPAWNTPVSEKQKARHRHRWLHEAAADVKKAWRSVKKRKKRFS